MVVQTKERPLSVPLTVVVNNTTRVEIDRDNLIRRLSMLFRINIVTATTPATGIIEDDLLNLVKKIRLVMDADDNKFNVDATKWFFVETFEKGTTPFKDTFVVPAMSTNTTFEFILTADFAQRRQDLSDTSALLDAPNKSSLFLEVDWGDISDIVEVVQNTTVDVAASEVRISLVEVFDDEGAEANAQLAASSFIDMREGTDQFQLTSAHTSFDDSIVQEDIDPTPSNILTHLLATREDINLNTLTSSIRANDIVTQFKVENVKGVGEKIVQSRFDIFRDGLKAEYSLELASLDTGLLYIDWIDQRRGGLANFVADALKWRFLNAAPETGDVDAIDLFTRYVSGVAQ